MVTNFDPVAFAMACERDLLLHKGVVENPYTDETVQERRDRLERNSRLISSAKNLLEVIYNDLLDDEDSRARIDTALDELSAVDSAIDESVAEIDAALEGDNEADNSD